MYSLSTKVENATDISDITLGRILRLKNYRVQLKKDAKSFVIAGASTSSSCFQCSLGYRLRLSVSLSWKIIAIMK
jgi:hypothetical protein